jgi:peptidoglycan-associated lipoprotein
MSKRFFVLLKLLFICNIAVVFVGCSLSAKLQKADKLYAEGAYFKVAKQYQKLQKRINKKDKKTKGEVAFKTGECNRLLFEMQKAVKQYNTAIKNNFSDSVIYLNLAKTYHALGNYDLAAKNYALYLKNNPLHREALAGMSACTQAREMLKNPSRYKIRSATEFNSRKGSDFCPVFSDADGSSVIITSNRDNSKKQKVSEITGKFNYDLFSFKKNRDGKWEKAVFMQEFNTPNDDGTASVSADGKEIYFTRCWGQAGATRGGEIMKATRSGGQWTAPENVVLFNDSSITVAHPAISPDGKYLYFVSDDKGGFGGKDIYRAENLDEKWGTPENLGEKINTSGNEMFPYAGADGVLYFASDGHYGFGGLDIFAAKKDSLGIWQVQNMLPPINSSADDFGIVFWGNEKKGYFSSNRNGGKKHLDKIYFFELPELTYAIEGKITDENGEILSDAVVKLVGNDGSIVKQRVKKDGTYRIKLAKNVNYVMLASNRGYLNSSSNLTTFDEKESKIFLKNFRLPTISKPVKMDNIFYEFAKWNLTPESETELNALVKLLGDNPNITIEIAAHTDMTGSDASNMELSQKRAQSVVNYLIKAGIAADRLTSKGYGKSRPVEVDKNISTKYRFLKTGDILTPEFIEQLPKEHREAANQINRRTEFRVVRTTYNLF